MSTLSNCSTLTSTMRGGEVLLAHQSLHPRALRRASVPRSSPDGGSVIFDADQEPTTVAVCEAHRSLGEFVVIDVTLEFDGVRLTTGDQLFEIVRCHGVIIRIRLRLTNSDIAVRISL